MINPRYHQPYSGWWDQFYHGEGWHVRETMHDDADNSFYQLVKKTIGDRFIGRTDLFYEEEWRPEEDLPVFWIEPAGDQHLRQEALYQAIKKAPADARALLDRLDYL